MSVELLDRETLEVATAVSAPRTFGCHVEHRDERHVARDVERDVERRVARGFACDVERLDRDGTAR